MQFLWKEKLLSINTLTIRLCTFGPAIPTHPTMNLTTKFTEKSGQSFAGLHFHFLLYIDLKYKSGSIYCVKLQVRQRRSPAMFGIYFDYS